MDKNKNLGKTGTDKVSGNSGVITGYVEYLYGNPSYQVTPKKTPGIAVEASFWVDDSQIEISE